MSVILTVLAALVASGVCAYHRAGLRTWFIVVVVTTLIAGIVFGAPWTLVILLLIEAAIGELFSGRPDWHQLLRQPKPVLSVEEQAFLDGPVEELCGMLDDWQITHELA